MDRAQQLIVFQSQTKNVKELDRAWRIAKIGLNLALKNDRVTEARIHTKTLSLIYSAWTEALFSKLIHTPYGFELSEIEDIKNRKGMEAKWRRCLKLAHAKVLSAPTFNPVQLSSAETYIKKLIIDYVKTPSTLRNRIAHGQWVVAFKSDSVTDISSDLTLTIEELNVVALDNLKMGFKGLADIIEAMIESPNNAFVKDYTKVESDLKSNLSRRSGYTLAGHIQRLKDKYAYRLLKPTRLANCICAIQDDG
ncbi:hypothetical protein GW579_20395 [Rahnella sp. Lac-M11]|jgi:hypothetical protein|uniref:Uncharacterized protein n=1 Tax=Rahnella contaminans TaxID=2703882 RepID=A0A6M2B7W6_9GAMM|nr:MULTISPECIES: hypothetical protein [Enterobacterales]EIS7449061.1 hypothetical protein [Citrobacter youngae]MBJ9160234.1 hypothetical protein [Citrobacter sp. FDAARGOS_156]NGX89446.1 hypothetical protein [Rahnella contaminans]SUY06436.1 Uncharacterised protein [Citrobacter youngae]